MPACGASVAPSTPMNGRLTTAARPNFGMLARDAAMLAGHPGAPKSKYDEYIGNNYGTYVGIFDYPGSVKEIGHIKGGGGQLCNTSCTVAGQKRSGTLPVKTRSPSTPSLRGH
jgi:hypothetical protein